jgi:serine/threonine protein kinase
MPEVQPGGVLSHYRLVEKIGEGGMGVVWKALDTTLNRHVALKLLPSELTGDPERQRRFLREARTAAAVTHPNIVTIYEVGEADGVTFLSMELVEGRALRSVIGGRPMPIGGIAGGRRDRRGLAGTGGSCRDLKPECS